MKSEEGGSGFLAGFIIGGLVGGALALLLSPRSGEETRDTLMDRGIELKVKAEEVASKAREEADDLLSRGKTVLDQQKMRVQEAVEEGKEAAAQKRSELLSRYRVAKEKGTVPPEAGPPAAPEGAPHTEEEQKPESDAEEGSGL